MRKLTKVLMSLFVVCAISSCNTENLNSDSVLDESSNVEQSSNSTESSSETDPSVEDSCESEVEVPSDSDSSLPDVPQTSIKDNYDCITIAEALQIAQEAGTNQSDKYYVYGEIVSVSNPAYGEMTITDGVDSLFVYGTYSADGVLRYSEMTEKPVAGDEVVLYGNLKTYNGEAEMVSAWIQEFTHEDPVIDPTEYTSMSVLQARESSLNEKVQITGTVASITYAFGMIPSGVYLVDNTSSIYVYSKDVASQVKVGNTITVAGEKTQYILADEQANAAKWGYQGSIQLQNAILVNNDKAVTDFPTSWIEKTTVKEIMETPFTENITNKIYEVNAFINKVDGSNFVNYYINDYDGVTGSYTYTQCSGSDFTWLNAYDGKLVTLYVTAINAKASASGCIYRFVPIKVTNDNASFDVENKAQFILDYYIENQFNTTTFTANPEIVLKTSVDSLLVGLEGVQVTYKSSNEDLIYFTTNENDELVFNSSTTNFGTATVTATATVGNQTASIEIEFEVKQAANYDDIDGVKEAIEASDNTEVTVIGIAGPSLVNQTGFYLIDEDGAIAVKCSSDTMSLISIGDKIVIKGKRTHYQPEGVAGQSVILDAELVENLYGNNTYSTASFDYSKTLTDLSKYSVSEDHTTTIYVVDVIVNVTGNQYFTSMNLTDPNNKSLSFALYCSSANQYSWLQQYAGQTIKVEIALCNWNYKKEYKGCIIAVVHEDGSKTYNELNYN